FFFLPDNPGSLDHGQGPVDYQVLVANDLRQLKKSESAGSFEISPLRRTQLTQPGDWFACVRTNVQDRPAHIAVFMRDVPVTPAPPLCLIRASRAGDPPAPRGGDRRRRPGAFSPLAQGGRARAKDGCRAAPEPRPRAARGGARAARPSPRARGARPCTTRPSP